MATIKGLLRRVKNFDTDKAIDNSFEVTTTDFAVLNKQQMYAGFDKSGEKFTKKYAAGSYAKKKNKMNPLPGYGTPDLFLSGEFQKQIKVDYSKGILTSMSSVEYAKYVEPVYRPYGLGGKLKKEFIKEKLQPALKKEISAGIGLSFNK